MEEGDHEDQGGAEQHGEIPEGTTGEGHQGAASCLAADRAESWTGRCCETTPRNLSRGHCSQCWFLLLQIIPHLELSSCLPHPGGNSQPFLLSFLCSTSDNPSFWCLCGGFGSHLGAPRCRSGLFLPHSPWVPVLQHLGSAQPSRCLWSGR